MGIITAITGVFDGVAAWFADILPTLVELFYTSTPDGTGSITVLGACALFGLGISVIMLCLNMVKDFLRFR